MIIYWAMYLIPGLVTLQQRTVGQRPSLARYWYLFAFLLVVVGLRETGGDYFTYKLTFNVISKVSLRESFHITESGYALLNWISARLGLGFYGVNTLCGLIYLIGFYRFARNEPDPLLLFTLSIPYQVIVTVMGYTRQGVALGIIMWGLAFLKEQKPVRYLAMVLVAAAFHSSAIVLAPLAYFGFSWRRNPTAALIGAACLIATLLLAYATLSGKFGTFYDDYVRSKHYSSQGALIRGGMTASAAIAFLLNWRSWPKYWSDRRIWLAISIASLVVLPLTLVASTAADRIGLYLMPLQLVVFSRLPTLQRQRAAQDIYAVGLLLTYAVVLGVWLTYGQFTSDLWLPYRSPLLGEWL